MVTIISGTNRKGAYSSRMAMFYAGLLREKGIESRIIDLKDLPPDFIFSALYDNSGAHAEFMKLQEIIDTTKKFVFIVPEYNGSFPGVLKAFLDGLQFPDSFRGKIGALVGISSGVMGSALAMSHLTDILNYLGMIVLPIKPRLGNIEKNFTEKQLTNAFYNDLLAAQVNQLLTF